LISLSYFFITSVVQEKLTLSKLVHIHELGRLIILIWISKFKRAENRIRFRRI